jgi:FKBP-type peptidyl-prolyl cis-trans isomerase (trigger factor)
MKFTQLQNQIEGSILKEQYLEAFLLQSTLIESLITQLLDFYYWKNFSKKEDADELQKNMYESVKKRLIRSSIHEQIKILREINVIDEELQKQLDEYRKMRNTVVHDLINQISNTELSESLKKTCHTGREIMKNKDIGTLIEILAKNI